MIGVSVKGAERVLANLAAAVKSVEAESQRAMTQSVALVKRMLTLELTDPEERDGFWGKVGSKGQGLSVRSGKTRSSLTPGTRIYRNGTTLIGVVGSAEKHLKLHEDGGVVYGTSPAGYLRIPTANAQTPAGVDRYAGRSIRDIPGAFLLKSKSGNLWAALREAKGSPLKLLYLLKRSARMRPRHIFARTTDTARPQVLEITRGAIQIVVQKANA